MIETMRFQLSPGANEEAFRSADRRLQSEFAYRQPGLLRRTTAVAADGDWIVIDIWRSPADAEAASDRWENDPAAAHFMSFVDRATLRVDRYTTLE